MDEKTQAKFAAQHRRGLIEKSAKGDPDAGRAMLQHAMAAMRRAAAQADEADAVALQWAADAIAQSIEGVQLDRSFGVERTKGRPRYSAIRRVVEAVPIWHQVRHLHEKLSAEGVVAPQRTAIQRVADRLGCSASKVRAAVAYVNGVDRDEGLSK